MVGLAGELVFKRTGIPSVLFLMGFGVLLGPVLHLADPTMVMELAPYLGTLALLVILFGLTGLRAMVLGSVADEVVKHSKVPVIHYPPV